MTFDVYHGRKTTIQQQQPEERKLKFNKALDSKTALQK